MRPAYLCAPPMAALALVSVLVVPGAAGAAAQRADGPHWKDCATEYTFPTLQCATITVPLDWNHPGGPRVTLALDRVPATDRAHRIGSLLFNPGGPGGPGTDAVGSKYGYFSFPRLKPLNKRYDLVGFDPRGVGASTPIRCGDGLHDPGVTTFPRTTAQYRRLVRLNRAAGEECRRRTGPLIDHVDTVSAAHDVDAIRRALGESRISWLGVSYGSEFGQTYARLYPHRVRRMVLDGIVDHQRSVHRDALDEARAIERDFGAFARWCAGSTGCALHGKDVRKVVTGLVTRPGGVPAAKYHRNANGEEITDGIYGQLYVTTGWPALSQAIAAAGDGDASGLLDSASYNAPSYGAYRTISCHDFPGEVRGLADLRRRTAEVKRAAPTMWRYSEFWDMTSGCLGWPVKAQNPPGPSRVSGAPPMLIVGNTGDPATPYAWARAVHRQIAGSRLLTYDGTGHTGLLNAPCAREYEVTYLTTGRLPARGTVCR